MSRKKAAAPKRRQAIRIATPADVGAAIEREKLDPKLTQKLEKATARLMADETLGASHDQLFATVLILATADAELRVPEAGKRTLDLRNLRRLEDTLTMSMSPGTPAWWVELLGRCIGAHRRLVGNEAS